MQRNLWLWDNPHPSPPPPYKFTVEQERQLFELLSQLGLNIIDEARGPVPLLTFGRRMLERLPNQRWPVSLPQFADALKHVIRQLRHDRLQVMGPTDTPGVGYVYNAMDPDTWPVKSGR
jgi:hypothetical protein